MRIELDEAVVRLQRGEVVAVPTDTVYGLAADPDIEGAVQHLTDLKQRPRNNPMILLVHDQNAVRPFVEHLPEGFEQLAYRFWPGPLTLVVPIIEERIPEVVRSGKSTTGFRVPHHAATRELLRRCGPLVVSSANISGNPTSTSAEMVEAEFGRDFPILIDGPNVVGIESTVLVWQSDQWFMVRRGVISPLEIEEVLGYEPLRLDREAFFPKAGHGIEFVIEGWPYEAPPQYVLGFEGRSYPEAKEVVLLGDLSKPDEIANHLYAKLRQMEQLQPQSPVWVDMDFPRVGILEAVAESLRRHAKG